MIPYTSQIPRNESMGEVQAWQEDGADRIPRLLRLGEMVAGCRPPLKRDTYAAKPYHLPKRLSWSVFDVIRRPPSVLINNAVD